MEWLTKHIGLAKSLGEFQFKGWLDKNASEALNEMGVKAGQVVLDLGCGSGTYTIPAARIVGESGRVYAIDKNKRALDVIREKAKREGLKNTMPVEASGNEEIQLRAETIDLTLLIDVLQEIDDKRILFSEIYRILKPGGIASVFPMHISEEEVQRAAAASGLQLRGRVLQGRIFIYRKPSQ
jgi:ubiquinone/menaquinone biosynthesis C-methylase UbiE